MYSCCYLIVCTCNSCRQSKGRKRASPRCLISSNDETAGGYFRALTLKHFGAALPHLSPVTEMDESELRMLNIRSDSIGWLYSEKAIFLLALGYLPCTAGLPS